MFSFAGDTVLDPFAGTGSTAVAAGRNSIGVEIDPGYVLNAKKRLREAAMQTRSFGAVHVQIECSAEPDRKNAPGGT